MTRAIALLLVIAMMAPAAAAGTPSGAVALAQSGGGLWALLQQLQQIYYQVWEWINGQMDVALDGVREQISPILDNVYAAETLSRWLTGLAGSLPSHLQYLLTGAAGRLRTIPAPKPGTPEEATQRVVRANPTGAVAERARVLDSVRAENTAGVAQARAAREMSEDVSQRSLDDPQPRVLSETATAMAQDLAARALQTPSTRAAVQLLVEAFAAQMDMTGRYHLDTTSRFNALVQQQVAISQQLSTNTERLATAVEFLTEEQKQRLIEEVTTATSMLSNSFNALEGIAGAGRQMREGTLDRSLYDSLRAIVRRR